jgi:hypothetical protein
MSDPRTADISSRTYVDITTHFKSGGRNTGGMTVHAGETLHDMFVRDEKSLIALGHATNWSHLSATVDGTMPVEGTVIHFLGGRDHDTNKTNAACDDEIALVDGNWTAIPRFVNCFMCQSVADIDPGEFD